MENPLFLIPDDVAVLLCVADKNHVPLYFVGGCVRDALRGVAPHDFDMCSPLPPDAVSALFSDFRVIETGIRHGTVTVLTKANRPVEITTFRTDGAYGDHRHPTDVSFCTSLREDAARRDFTVNAMAYHPVSGIFDFFGGQEDLENRILRCVGNPETRFSEDALRILRALRFSAVLGFSLEKQTEAALHTKKDLLSFVAKERLLSEFRKLITGADAPHLLCAFRDVFSVFLPSDLLPAYASLSENRLCAVFAGLNDEITRIAAFLYLCGCTEPVLLMRSLTFENAMIRAVSGLLSLLSRNTPDTEAALRYRLSAYDVPAVRHELCLRRQLFSEDNTETEALLQTIIHARLPCRLSDLAISGRELIALGFRGHAVSEALTALLSAVIENRIENTREALLSYAATFPPS